MVCSLVFLCLGLGCALFLANLIYKICVLGELVEKWSDNLGLGLSECLLQLGSLVSGCLFLLVFGLSLSSRSLLVWVIFCLAFYLCFDLLAS